MKRSGSLAVVVLLALVFALLETRAVIAQGRAESQRAPTQDVGALALEGNYNCTGTNPDGSGYRGTTTVTHISRNRYSLEWSIGTQTFTGTGALEGNTLTVDWGDTWPVIYKVKADGTLDGTWSNGRATETLVPLRASKAPRATALLEGNFNCTGTSPELSEYHGTLRVTRNSRNRYTIEWKRLQPPGMGLFRVPAVLEGRTLTIDWGFDGLGTQQVTGNGTLGGRWTHGTRDGTLWCK